MLLDPGPIPLVSVDFTAMLADTPPNLAYVNENYPPLDAIVAEMEAVLPLATVILDNLPDDGNAATLDDLDQNVALYNTVDIDSQPPLGDAQVNTLSEQMIQVYAVIPGEAFQPVPAGLTVPFAGISGTPYSRGSVALNNLTRPGDSNFFPGDVYQIAVNLQPQVGGQGTYAGVDVTMNPALNGAAMDPVDLCLTDANGFLNAQGTFQPGDVGDWTIDVVFTLASGTGPDGTNAAAPDASLQFTVQAAPAGTVLPTGGSSIVSGGLHPVQTLGQPCASGQALGATIVNTGAGTSTNFFSGDTWTLTVTGAPNSDVLITALYNNAALPWVQLGTTDANGNFTLTGVMDDGVIGTWEESFQIGSQVWSANLAFTVSAAIPTPAA